MAPCLESTPEGHSVFKNIRLQLFLIFIVLISGSSAMVRPRYKCCPGEQVFNHNLRCTNTSRRIVQWNSDYVKYGTEMFSCNGDPESTPTTRLWNRDFWGKNLSTLSFCWELSINGSLMIQICPSMMNETRGCDGILTKIKFWGADIAMNMNIVHVVLCFLVVIFYMIFSDHGRRTYNRAVLRHNACLFCMGCTLTILGLFSLCHRELNGVVVVLLWLILQFFTLASATWLNVICFDMTLVITRFRWMIGSIDNSEREQNRKFLVYGIFAWGGALIPTLFAGIMEICPPGSVSPAIRANYINYKGGQNLTVNMYFFFIPLVTLFFNNVLFVYTSYKIFMIKRSTAIVNRNQANDLSKKYLLFLRLYLLMGAPWFFGMLLACLNQLLILKVCRIVQPILWLLMLVTHKKVRQKIADKLGFSRSDNNPSAEYCLEQKIIS